MSALSGSPLSNWQQGRYLNQKRAKTHSGQGHSPAEGTYSQTSEICQIIRDGCMFLQTFMSKACILDIGCCVCIAISIQFWKKNNKKTFVLEDEQKHAGP